MLTCLAYAQDQKFSVTSKNKLYFFTIDAKGKGIVLSRRHNADQWKKLWTLSGWAGEPEFLSDDGRYLVFVSKTVNCDPSCMDKPLIDFHSKEGHIDTIYVQNLISDKSHVGIQGEKKFIRKIKLFSFKNKTYLKVNTLEGEKYTFDITTGNKR